MVMLCHDAILLENGIIIDRGPVRRVAEDYLAVGSHESAEMVWSFEGAPGNDLVKLRSVNICDPTGKVSYDQRCRAPITVNMEFWCLQKHKVIPNFHLYNQNGVLVFVAANTHSPELAANDFQTGVTSLHLCHPNALAQHWKVLRACPSESRV